MREREGATMSETKGKFLLVGEPVLDEIHKPNGEVTEDFGGIFYSLISMANIVPENSTIYPVFPVGEKEYEKIFQRLKRYKTLDLAGLYKVNEDTRRVKLFYNGPDSRSECSTMPVAPVPFEKIEPFLNVDAVLVNMVSGVDIEIETLHHIRESIKPERTSVHMDIHDLTLGTSIDGTRYPRYPENWREWFSLVDTIQMNEVEASILRQGRPEEELAQEILHLGVRGMIITRGSRGLTVFFLTEGQLSVEHLSPLKIPTVSDPTGCGDTFASVFCFRYSQTRDLMQSAHFANHVAGIKATFSGIDGIDALPKILKESCM